MRFTRLMVLALLLVALAVVINTLAFNRAEVTNALSIQIYDTDQAGLAFDAPTVLDSGLTTSIVNGKLTIAINDKMQPDSVYTFRNAFKIQNNSDASVTLSCSTTGFTSGIAIGVFNATGDTNLCGASLASSASVQAYITVTVPANFVAAGGTLNATENGSLIVTGQK